MSDSRPSPDPIYPHARPLRRMIVMAVIAAMTIGTMWFFR